MWRCGGVCRRSFHRSCAQPHDSLLPGGNPGLCTCCATSRCVIMLRCEAGLHTVPQAPQPAMLANNRPYSNFPHHDT